ncbi:MAG: hypothetical protein NTW80_05920, partial [Deltaproteobacteria bacterium]|nr:hypothetical protein [Deltaproteobacteria bacterium]
MDPAKISATSPAARTSGSLSAVRAACHRALTARDRMLQDYPQWEAWRRRGREIKTEAISRLDELLERLAREVEAWGGRV